MSATQKLYRYERKYLFPTNISDHLRVGVLTSPAGFHEQYQSRVVNSIYFDTPQYEYLQQNVEGSGQRLKVRVRWYGSRQLGGSLLLEVKRKDGSVQYKTSARLELVLDGSARIQEQLSQITAAVQSSLMGEIEEAPSLEPVLANTYTRQYFYSPRYGIRITVDDQLGFQSLADWLQSRNLLTETSSTLECKYAVADDPNLHHVTQHLPLQVTKSSKYVIGMLRVYPHLEMQLAN